MLTFRTEGFKERQDGSELGRRKAWLLTQSKHIVIPWASGRTVSHEPWSYRDSVNCKGAEVPAWVQHLYPHSHPTLGEQKWDMQR